MTQKSLSWARGVLGLPSSFTEREAKAVYRSMVRELHPDVATRVAVLAESPDDAIKTVNEAWELIRDDFRRRSEPATRITADCQLPIADCQFTQPKAEPASRIAPPYEEAKPLNEYQRYRNHVVETAMQAGFTMALVAVLGAGAIWAVASSGFLETHTYTRTAAIALPARASEDRLTHAILEGNNVAVAQYLKEGINPNFATSDGNSPLVIAVARGSDAQVKLLLYAGAKSGDGPMAALTRAVYQNRLDYVRLLLSRGASANERTDTGSALGHAKSVEVARELLHAGADINDSRNPKRQTPLDQALAIKAPDLVSFLQARGAVGAG